MLGQAYHIKYPLKSYLKNIFKKPFVFSLLNRFYRLSRKEIALDVEERLNISAN